MRRLSTEQKTEKKRAFIKWLKGLIVPGIFLVILTTAVIFVVNYKEPENTEEVIPVNAYADGEGTLKMENDRLAFVMDKTTTQFSVKVKSSGKVWTSNPAGAADDPVAMAAEKGRVQSTLTLTYTDESGLETMMNNFDYSISNGLYSIEQPDDKTIKVNYSIGEVNKEFTIPPVTTKENYEKWIAAMDKSEGTFTSQYYKKYDINNLKAKDNKDELLQNYPILADQVIYVLRDKANDSIRKKLEGYFAKAGYTPEDFAADKALSNAESTSDKPVFDVSMIYKLDGDNLLVEVPYSEVKFKKEFPVYKINPLPFFGAGTTDEDGFLFVPEGGGGKIKFNNGKVSQPNYYANVYGWDMGQLRDAVVHETNTAFGTFGISTGNDSFICILEEGAPYAAIEADVSEKANSFNYVNAEYSCVLREKFDVSDKSNRDIYVFLPELPNETMTERFSFIDSGKIGDMAKDYQSYLISKSESFAKKKDTKSVPVVADFVGATDKIRQIAGVPVSRPLELTSYNAASRIYRDLKKNGIENLSAKYTGWCNGGVNQKILKNIKTVGVLGPEKDLAKLSGDISAEDGTLYLDGITSFAKDSDFTDGFLKFRDSARFLSKEMAAVYPYDPVYYAQDESKKPSYLLHEGLALEMADRLVKKSAKLGASVSFNDIGSDLAGDYYRKDLVSREKALLDQQAKLKELSDAGNKICINTGNDYAVPYVSLVTNMDLKGNRYTIIDEYVPFYQMALHGHVDYTGKNINISGDPVEQVLNCAEYGAGLSFSLMDKSSYVLQNSSYTEYYASTYSTCKNELLDIVNKYNERLGNTFNKEMTGHENLTQSVSVTTYEDGTKVYVNYGYEDYSTDDGVVVPARDYVSVG